MWCCTMYSTHWHCSSTMGTDESVSLQHALVPRTLGMPGGHRPLRQHIQRFLYRVPIVATAGGRFTTNGAGFMTR